MSPSEGEVVVVDQSGRTTRPLCFPDLASTSCGRTGGHRLERDARVGVTKHRSDINGRKARADVEGGCGVTQVMDGDALQASRLGCLGEAPVADVPVREVLPVATGEHEGSSSASSGLRRRAAPRAPGVSGTVRSPASVLVGPGLPSRPERCAERCSVAPRADRRPATGGARASPIRRPVRASTLNERRVVVPGLRPAPQTRRGGDQLPRSLSGDHSNRLRFAPA